MGKTRNSRLRRRGRTPHGDWIGPRPERLERRTLPAVSLIVGPNVNISRHPDYQGETTIAINPMNPTRLFAASNDSGKLFGAVSEDGGKTWTGREVATGGPGGDSLPHACCDPHAAFDSVGNLFLVYVAVGDAQTGATSGNNTARTLNDNTRSWTTNAWTGFTLRMTSGAARGETRRIVSNTATELTLNAAWPARATLVANDGYAIEFLDTLETGRSSAMNGDMTFKPAGMPRWMVDQWKGKRLRITDGPGKGQVRTIESNTVDTLTLDAPWDAGMKPNALSSYAIESFKERIAVARSDDDGRTFSLKQFVDNGLGDVDYPAIATGPGSVWVAWPGNGGTVYAAGASVSGPGAVGSFTSQVVAMNVFGNYEDIAVGPTGQVLVSYWSEKGGNKRIYTRLDPDGLGPRGFGDETSRPTILGAANSDTNRIPAVMRRTIVAYSKLAWDRSATPDGRLYLVYNDKVAAGSNDTDVYMEVSTDGGKSFMPRRRVNDANANSQFMPAVAVDPVTGFVAVSWYDARDDRGAGSPGDTDRVPNNEARIYATVSTDGGRTFSTPNTPVGAQTSNAGRCPDLNEYGDYTSLDFYNGAFYPIWTDNSPALVPTSPQMDIATAKVAVSSSNVLASFEGLRRLDRTVRGPEPPDPQIAVGPSQVMEAVNFGLATYDKNTGTRISTRSLADFFAPLNPGMLFDPVLTYDETLGKDGRGQVQSRFIVAAADVDIANKKTFVDIAVSNDSDATHGFTEMRRIDISESTAGGVKLWGSYTRIGWNADAVVLTVNMNQFPFALEAGGPYDHVQILSLNATSLNDANNATFSGNKFDVNGGPPFLGLGNVSLVPAVMHGTASGGAQGGPMWFVEEGSFIPLLQTTIRLIRVDKILAGALTGTSFDVPVPQYRYLLPKRQPGPGTAFDASADTRINSVAFRSNRLVVAHTVGTGSLQVRGPDHARWYDFNVGGATPTLTQSGEVNRGPNVDTYYPSIEIATNGDLGLTYMESGPGEFISMGITGRAAADPAGALRPVTLVRTGLGSYTGSRLGDYSGMAVDPIKGTTFWAVNAYKAISNGTTWGTAIAAFSFQDPAPRPLDVIDNRNMAYRDVGRNWKLLNTGYRGDARINDAGANTEYARWVFNRPAGRYEVFLTWQVAFDRGTIKNSANASYNVYDGTTKIATISVNQQLAPDSVVFDGAQWKFLGIFTTKNNGLTVELVGDPNASVVADAAFIVDPPPPASSSSEHLLPAGVGKADGPGHVLGAPSGAGSIRSFAPTANLPGPRSVDFALAATDELDPWSGLRARRRNRQPMFVEARWG